MERTGIGQLLRSFLKSNALTQIQSKLYVRSQGKFHSEHVDKGIQYIADTIEAAQNPLNSITLTCLSHMRAISHNLSHLRCLHHFHRQIGQQDHELLPLSYAEDQTQMDRQQPIKSVRLLGEMSSKLHTGQQPA